MQQTRLKETDNVCRLTAEHACKTWSSNTESAAQIRLKSLTELQHCYFPWSGPQLVLDWVCVQTREKASSKPGSTGTSQRSCCHLYYYYVIFIFGLYMQNVATNQVRLSSLMEAEQEALRGTQHVIADAQSSSTSNWKSVSLFTSLLAPSVWTSHCCAQDQTQTDVCVCQWPLNAAAHVHLKLSQSAKLLQKLLRSSAAWKCSHWLNRPQTASPEHAVGRLGASGLMFDTTH